MYILKLNLRVNRLIGFEKLNIFHFHRHKRVVGVLLEIFQSKFPIAVLDVVIETEQSG